MRLSHKQLRVEPKLRKADMKNKSYSTSRNNSNGLSFHLLVFIKNENCNKLFNEATSALLNDRSGYEQFIFRKVTNETFQNLELVTGKNKTSDAVGSLAHCVLATTLLLSICYFPL